MSAPPLPPRGTPCSLDHMAEQAFEAHAALIRQESATPGLAANPYWQALRDTAFARFSAVYRKAMPS